MTYKKALNDLKRQVEHFENGTEFSYSLPPLKVAIKALEKQIPKKPIDDRYPWCICPVCGGSIYLKNVQEHIQCQETTYCEHCGQALDWSDTE